jgi:hypothetical protein
MTQELPPKSHAPAVHKSRVEVLEQALMLACRRIADSGQSYEEANTPEGWRDVYLAAAETDRSPEQVIADKPRPRRMTEAERQFVRARP